MKRLTGIKLVNWHAFVDETIKIKNSVLLSGENGYAFLLLGDCWGSHGLLLHFLCHYDLPLF